MQSVLVSTAAPFPAELIQSRLCQVTASGNPQVDAVMRHLFQENGKMLRPRLVYHTAALNPHDPLVVRDIAAAVELIHLASLVHDDVIDQALLRRGQESLNARYGNQVSVLAGDFLFAAAFNLINRHQQNQVMEIVTRTIKTMCSGEIIQMGQAYDLSTGPDQYYDKTYRKTACLFATSCQVGAFASAASPEQTKKLEQFGLCLGYAYQIIDDVMDFVSDSQTLGKPVGNDIIQGNITLPVIYAMTHPEYGPRLIKLLKQRASIAASLTEIIDLIVKSGSIGTAIEHSAAFLERGIEHLDSLAPSESLEALKKTCFGFIDNYRPVLGRYHSPMERRA